MHSSLVRVGSHSPILRQCRPSFSWLQKLQNGHSSSSRVLQFRGLSNDSEDAANGASQRNALAPLDTFARRHIGPDAASTTEMLNAICPAVNSLDEFVQQVLPSNILSSRSLSITGPTTSSTPQRQEGFSESQVLTRLRSIASQNKVLRSYIGCGYAGTHVPEVIKRNVLENPSWYTSYTPYQPEISQGRLESLLNYQTLVSDLTALPIANASLLDEPTAAAEAMTISLNALPASRQKREGKTFFVSHLVNPQTIAVLRSRAAGFGVKVLVGDVLEKDSVAVRSIGEDLIGVLAQYPDTEGGVEDFRSLADAIHSVGGTFSVATDLLALTILTPPGEFGVDIAFGNAQRFGVPFGYGGPHAAFFAVREKYTRKIPGRLVGVSKDRLGNTALRLALQTREQHIRREKATSNVCTAQALLANMSAFYALYHGPEGLRRIAEKVVKDTRVLEEWVRRLGFETGRRREGGGAHVLFDTVVVDVGDASVQNMLEWGVANKGINLRAVDERRIGVTLDETVRSQDIKDILDIFNYFSPSKAALDRKEMSLEEIHETYNSLPAISSLIPLPFQRTSTYLTQPVFNTHQSETKLLRYIHHLQSKDLSLVHSMIPLGSCTMKLNATTEMVPVSWPEFSSIHPFVPPNQAKGYKVLIEELEADLATITGFDAVSLQPNSGAQGEFSGLRVIRKYHDARQPGTKRDICLIPVSAHGTNPASAAMAGMRVIPIKCDMKTGNLDMSDLEAKCIKHSHELAAVMITYPSTFGVFEPDVKRACEIVHEYGGQVYMDGANMNAQIGLCSPGEIGADVCHLNLHKTFCIPHGGGGPGVGPIAVKSHLEAFLPGHPLIKTGGVQAIHPVSGAPWGSASILPISWAYIKMMGGRSLTHATKITLLNANYLMSRLAPYYKILYTNASGRCAHEFILDVRPFKDSCGIEAIDIAKRLQDYGFHAPTMSWPVPGTLMVEPTESEDKAELDRFADALVSIRGEIEAVENGLADQKVNMLKMAPHTQRDLLVGEWTRPYTREEAAYPLPWLNEKKFWPSVTRVDDGMLHPFVVCQSC